MGAHLPCCDHKLFVLMALQGRPGSVSLVVGVSALLFVTSFHLTYSSVVVFQGYFNHKQGGLDNRNITTRIYVTYIERMLFMAVCYA